MGFKSLIAKQVKGAMRILGTDEDGLASMHSYVSVDDTGGTYDALTRTVQTPEVPYSNIPMVFTRFSVSDTDDKVRPETDRKVLVAALDLPVVPTVQDKIISKAGDVYDVMRLLSDPADAMHIIHVRFTEVNGG